MSSSDRLIASYFGSRSGNLAIDGVEVGVLVSKHGTPAFVYAASVLERKCRALREILPDRFGLFYSVKANPNPSILRCFLSLGCGLEIASAGEYYLARHAGCPPEKIVYAGPGKTEEELEAVLKGGIGELHVESKLEGERIHTISKRLGIRPKVAVRVNPTAEVQGGAMRMGGKAAPFGVDEENLDDVLDCLLKGSRLEITGVHIFIGTQILDYEVLIAQYRRGIEIGKKASARLGRSLQTLDFGGGLGIPYFNHEAELDLRSLGRELRTLHEETRGEPAFQGTRFILEPGRFLVGESGIYLARVNDVKVSRGKKFVILDGGMNHHLAASGNLGQVIKRNFPLALVNKLDSPPEEKVDVVGPLCTPMDVLARDVALPAAEPGDLVGIFQSGAYARSASPLGFLSHPAPVEVLVEEGRDKVICRRGTFVDATAERGVSGTVI